MPMFFLIFFCPIYIAKDFIVSKGGSSDRLKEVQSWIIKQCKYTITILKSFSLVIQSKVFILKIETSNLVSTNFFIRIIILTVENQSLNIKLLENSYTLRKHHIKKCCN